jgi:hypothetical protein
MAPFSYATGATLIKYRLVWCLTAASGTCRPARLFLQPSFEFGICDLTVTISIDHFEIDDVGRAALGRWTSPSSSIHRSFFWPTARAVARLHA